MTLYKPAKMLRDMKTCSKQRRRKRAHANSLNVKSLFGLVCRPVQILRDFHSHFHSNSNYNSTSNSHSYAYGYLDDYTQANAYAQVAWNA